MKVLVTGATGLVGLETLERLRARRVAEVVGTSRGGAPGGVVAWDMANEAPPGELAGPWDAMVHTAADTRWTQSYGDAFRANVATVAALEPLTSAETHVIHVSTAYAVGLRGDGGSEATVDYRNAYEWSKAHAERLARQLFDRLTIVRPPLIIGRRSDGRAARFAGMYTILRGIASSMVPAVVAIPEGYFDVIPVDDLADVLAALVDGEPEHDVQIVAAGEAAPRVKPIVDLIADSLNDWRSERGLDPLSPPALLTPESWDRFFMPFARDHLTRRQHQMLDLLDNFLPYLAITKPLEPTHRVTAVEPCVRASVRYWADAHAHLAGMAARPWKLLAA